MTDTFSTPAADPFMESGASYPSLKFTDVGDVRAIVVRKVDDRIDIDMDTNLPKTWPSGDPMKVYVFTGESDGETMQLWVRGNMVKAIREAVTAAGLPSVIDTKVTLKFDAVGEPKKKGFNGAKLFKAKVEKVAPLPATPYDPDNEPF